METFFLDSDIPIIVLLKCIFWENVYFKVRYGAFHLVRTHSYMLSGPTHPLFECNTQWKCIGVLSPPTHPRCVRTKWKAPIFLDFWKFPEFLSEFNRYFEKSVAMATEISIFDIYLNHWIMSYKVISITISFQ